MMSFPLSYNGSAAQKDNIPRHGKNASRRILNQVQDDGEKLSAVGDFIRKRSGSFRNSAISAGRLQDAFATLRFHPKDFRMLSQHCDFGWKTSGCFRNAAISSGRPQDAFATPRFRPEDFRKTSQRRDFVRKTSGRLRNAADKQNKINSQDNSW
jgi:hypothetical protein